jgi:hypothetical protein
MQEKHTIWGEKLMREIGQRRESTGHEGGEKYK